MDKNTSGFQVLLLLCLPAELKSRLREAGERTGHKMSGIARLAIERYLDERGHVEGLLKRKPTKRVPNWKRVLDTLWAHAELLNEQMTVRLSNAEISGLVNMPTPKVRNAFRKLEKRGDIWGRPSRRGRHTIVLKSTTFVPKVDADAVFGAPIEYLRPVQDVALSARPGAVSG